MIHFWLCFSSVPPPKDISFFRTEREHALRRGLQVRRSLEGCRKLILSTKTWVCVLLSRPGRRWLKLCRFSLRLTSCRESWTVAWVWSTLLTVCLHCCSRWETTDHKKEGREGHLKHLCVFVCSSIPTDHITWLRSNICSCSDGGDSAATPASLRSFILITRSPHIRFHYDRQFFLWLMRFVMWKYDKDSDEIRLSVLKLIMLKHYIHYWSFSQLFGL